MYGESREFNFIETFGDYGLLKSGTSYLLYSVCSSCMCIHYLLHGSSIVKLALSLSSHSPILMNRMLRQRFSWVSVIGGWHVALVRRSNYGFRSEEEMAMQ